MKQCATLGEAIARMWESGAIPSDDPAPPPPGPSAAVKGAKLRLVK
jgi:hypothetical protein